MVQLAYAFLANSAEFTPDGRLWVLGGDIDTLYVQQLPATHPTLTLVLKLSVPPAECGREHRLRIRLADPEGSDAIPVNDVTFVPQALADQPLRDVGVGLAFILQQQKFERMGEYTFRIVVGNRTLRTLPLRVVQPSSQGPAALPSLQIRRSSRD